MKNIIVSSIIIASFILSSCGKQEGNQNIPTTPSGSQTTQTNTNTPIEPNGKEAPSEYTSPALTPTLDN